MQDLYMIGKGRYYGTLREESLFHWKLDFITCVRSNIHIPDVIIGYRFKIISFLFFYQR